MNATICLFLEVLACVLFLLAGIGVPQHPRFQYIGWGLFLISLCLIFGSLAHLR